MRVCQLKTTTTTTTQFSRPPVHRYTCGSGNKMPHLRLICQPHLECAVRRTYRGTRTQARARLCCDSVLITRYRAYRVINKGSHCSFLLSHPMLKTDVVVQPTAIDVSTRASTVCVCSIERKYTQQFTVKGVAFFIASKEPVVVGFLFALFFCRTWLDTYINTSHTIERV